MSSILLEAILLNNFGAEFIAGTLASVVKAGDIVTDIFFLLDLQQFDEIFPTNDLLHITDPLPFSIPATTYLMLACVFTGIGIAFDLIMSTLVVTDWQEEKEAKRGVSDVMMKEGVTSAKFWSKVANAFFEADVKHERNWVWWKNINFFIEELPQLLILVLFWLDWGPTATTADQYEFMKKVKTSVIVSALFTSLTMLRVIIGYSLFRYRKKKTQEEGNKKGFFLPSFSGSEEERGKKGLDSYLPKLSKTQEETKKSGVGVFLTKLSAKEEETNKDGFSARPNLSKMKINDSNKKKIHNESVLPKAPKKKRVAKNEKPKSIVLPNFSRGQETPSTTEETSYLDAYFPTLCQPISRDKNEIYEFSKGSKICGGPGAKRFELPNFSRGRETPAPTKKPSYVGACIPTLGQPTPDDQDDSIFSWIPDCDTFSPNQNEGSMIVKNQKYSK